MNTLPNQREELAAIIRQEHGYPASKLADVLLAAGYRKPRIVSTTDELDALPLCSIVMNNGSNPHAWQKRTDLYVGDAWYLTSDTDYGMDSYAVFEDGATATVLHEPEAGK